MSTAQHPKRGGSGGGKDHRDGDLKEAFELYDQDRDGLISARELHSVLEKLGKKCSSTDCSRMISSVDSDGDGKVNFEEFKKIMSKGFAKKPKNPIRHRQSVDFGPHSIAK